MKTVYLFFQTRNRVRKLDVLKLYAYTTKKKLYEEFKRTRDMSLFHVDIKEVSDSDFKHFQSIHGKERLTIMHFETIDIHEDIRKAKNVEIVGPVYEEETVFLNVDKIFGEVAKSTLSSVKCLKEKYLKALQYFHYTDFLIYKSYDNMNDSFYSGLLPFEDMEDGLCFHNSLYYSFNIKYDQLSVFIYFYGQTMKLET